MSLVSCINVSNKKFQSTLFSHVYCFASFFFFLHSFFFFFRFRHFEELHRRLKEFSEYNLHLPPKHFLSTGLDVPVIQERCELLDKYLKVNLTYFF